MRLLGQRNSRIGVSKKSALSSIVKGFLDEDFLTMMYRTGSLSQQTQGAIPCGNRFIRRIQSFIPMHFSWILQFSNFSDPEVYLDLSRHGCTIYGIYLLILRE